MILSKITPLSVLSCINAVAVSRPPSCSTCRHVGRRLSRDTNVCYLFSYHSPEIGGGGMDVFPLAKDVRKQGECGPEGRFYKRDHTIVKVVIGNAFRGSTPLE
jgi:hypothetical protein